MILLEPSITVALANGNAFLEQQENQAMNQKDQATSFGEIDLNLRK